MKHPWPTWPPASGKPTKATFGLVPRPGGDVVYRWETSRAADCLERIIPKHFIGVIQCVGYNAYRTFAQSRIGIELAGWWAHVRRKIHEALEQSPRQAGWIMRQLQHLYRIEAKLRERKAGPNLREAVRNQESAMIVPRIKKALLLFKSRRHLPQSAFGLAIDYTLNLWSVLEVYLRDGRIEIDNNLVENAIRPTALGKKNWLFMGEAAAGQRGAIIYTVIESCRRRGIDPYAYLHDVFTKLPTLKMHQINAVTPESWAKNNKQTGAALKDA